MRWIKLPEAKLNDSYEPFAALDFSRKGEKWTVHRGRSFVDSGKLENVCLFFNQNIRPPIIVSLAQYLEIPSWDYLPRPTIKIIDFDNGSILYNVYKEFVRGLRNASR